MSDAAELARLREKLEKQGMLCYTPAVALIEELEKAQLINECHCTNVAATTRERDSARALLREASPWLNAGGNPGAHAAAEAIRASIAKELGQ